MQIRGLMQTCQIVVLMHVWLGMASLLSVLLVNFSFVVCRRATTCRIHSQCDAGHVHVSCGQPRLGSGLGVLFTGLNGLFSPELQLGL